MSFHPMGGSLAEGGHATLFLTCFEIGGKTDRTRYLILPRDRSDLTRAQGPILKLRQTFLHEKNVDLLVSG